jgi:uncharacterized membrane protein (GlpM family)
MENKTPARILFDLAAMLALFTGLSYAIGFTYYLAYFRQLAIPESLALSSNQLFEPVVILFIPFTIVGLFFVLNHNKPESSLRVLWADIPLFVLLGSLVYASQHFSLQIAATGQSANWLYWVQMFVLVCLIISDLIRKSSIAYDVARSSMEVKVLCAAIVFIIMLCTAFLFGVSAGNEILRGDFSTTYSVILAQQPDNPTISPGPYVLVFVDENNYYLIRMENPMPSNPDLLIVLKTSVPAIIVNRLP